MNSILHEPGPLAAFGYTKDIADRYPSLATAEMPGRVVRAHYGACDVVTPAGFVRCRTPGDDVPVPGDWVLVRHLGPDAATVSVILERNNAIERRDATKSRVQTMAVNVDCVLVLHGIDRPHRVGRLERLSILAWDAGVEPVVLLTKADLAAGDRAVITVDEARSKIAEILPSVAVHTVSAVTGEGIASLAQYLLPGATVALAGESGSGKSTLINRIVGGPVQLTGQTRASDSKGRHTTTWRELVPAPGGAVLVDLPGVWTVGVTASADGRSRAYADVLALADGCRFRDCAHDREPDCAITAALHDGRLSAERWKSYRKLLREQRYEARRATERERRSGRR